MFQGLRAGSRVGKGSQRFFDDRTAGVVYNEHDPSGNGEKGSHAWLSAMCSQECAGSIPVSRTNGFPDQACCHSGKYDQHL